MIWYHFHLRLKYIFVITKACDFSKTFFISIPHAHAYDGYRACDRAHVPRRDVHARASVLHPRSRHHVREMGHCVNGYARELKPYAHVCVNDVH